MSRGLFWSISRRAQWILYVQRSLDEFSAPTISSTVSLSLRDTYVVLLWCFNTYLLSTFPFIAIERAIYWLHKSSFDYWIAWFIPFLLAVNKTNNGLVIFKEVFSDVILTVKHQWSEKWSISAVYFDLRLYVKAGEFINIYKLFSDWFSVNSHAFITSLHKKPVNPTSFFLFNRQGYNRIY